MSKKKNKVLLIGWDAADWKIINPLIDAGKMPTLEKLINGGVMGNLATLDPPLSPMLWTSIATGKTADQHGVLGFTQPDKEGKTVHPVLSTTRKVKAIWNILMQNGLKSNVVSWWPSHPAEPINGVYVSNFFHNSKTKVNRVPVVAKGAVHPESLTKTLAELRVFPWELTSEHIIPFVPKAAKINQDKNRRLNALAKIISDAATVHSSATWVMENTEWDFMAVYYDAIDHFCHGFMNFHPPKMDIVPQNLYEQYKDVVNGGYMFHDMMLERLVQLAGKDTTIILVSDHGFHSDHLRPQTLPKEPAGPAAQHRPYGIICVNGPNIIKDELLFGASLLDITPTILKMFDLPIGKDMVGKPLLQIFENPGYTKYIDSWEEVDGDCGMHDSDKISDPWAEQEAMEQLIALGYIEPPDKNVQKNIDRTVRESKFYLARVHMEANRFKKALPILENLFFEEAKEDRFGMRLIQCYLGLRRPKDSLKVMEEISKTAKEVTPGMNLFSGKIHFALGDIDKALEYFEKAEKIDQSLPGLFISLANVYLRKKMYEKAEELFTKALSIDGDSPACFFGLGLVYYHRKEYEDAADNILTSVGLRYFNPTAHFYLGKSLIKLEEYERAAEAFYVSVNQAPGMEKAHNELIKLFENQLDNPQKALWHKNFIREKILPAKTRGI